MASRAAEKEAGHMTSPATSKISQSVKESKRHTTANDESRLPSSTTSHKEEVTSKRSAPVEDSVVPKKKPKGLVKLYHPVDKI